ncbi:MAG: hydrogen gas-evolving membrane-bound hydrogenase subunit E [Bacillota bacterium]|nr:hydrogen gas-evolving membrane-bound hydrogenase subunit E [Bacillota bacterium]
MSYLGIIFLIILTLILRFMFGVQTRALLTLYIMGLIIVLFAFTVAEMPPFGSAANPVFNEISARFLEKGAEETGAVNIVSSVILDYRAYDTLGEATVLFAAIAAVIATLKSH